MQVTSVRTMANTKDGCSFNNDTRSGGYELFSLSSEYCKHLLSVVSNILNTLNNQFNELYDIFNFITNFISLLSNSITCICKIIELIPCIKSNLSPEKYLCRPNLRDFETCLNEINTKINSLKTNFCSIETSLICIKCYLINIRSLDISGVYKNFFLYNFICLLRFYNCIISKVSSIHCCVDKSKCKIKEIKDLRVYLGKMIKDLDILTCSYSKGCGCLCVYVVIFQSFKVVKSQIEKLLSDIDTIMYNFDIIQYNTRFLKHSNEFTIVILQVSNNLIYKFIRCSLQSLSTQLNHNIITNWDRQTSNIGGLDMNNVVMSVMSRIMIDESIFVLSRLYSHCKIKSEIDETLRILEGCVCLRIYNRDWRDKIETFDKPLPNINTRYYNPIIVSLIVTHVLNYGNYMCLCLVVRYILLSDLYSIIRYNEHMYMDLLSFITRNYQKYSYSITHNFNSSKLIMLIVTTFDKILTWMISKYTEYNNDLNYTKRCFCKNHNDPYYHYLISTILFVSSLIENIWSMDTETVRMCRVFVRI